MMTIFIPMLHRKFRGGRKGSEVTVSLPDWQHTTKALGKGLDTFSTRFKPSFYEIELAHENKTHRARIWLSEEDARILYNNLSEFVLICDTIDAQEATR